MPTLEITVNGELFTKEISLADEVGLQNAMMAVNNTIPEEENHHTSKEAYLTNIITNWANSNGASNTAIDAMITQCINSWSLSPSLEVPAPPELTGEELKTYLLAYAANKRWSIEVGGMSFAGMNVPTDDRAKLLLMGAAGSMADTDTASFIVGSTAVNLTGAQFKAIYAAIVNRVQVLFAKQTLVIEDINNGIITTTNQIDAFDWTV